VTRLEQNVLDFVQQETPHPLRVERPTLDTQLWALGIDGGIARTFMQRFNGRFRVDLTDFVFSSHFESDWKRSGVAWQLIQVTIVAFRLFLWRSGTAHGVFSFSVLFVGLTSCYTIRYSYPKQPITVRDLALAAEKGHWCVQPGRSITLS
jgi:hypothetical protein